LVCPAVSILAIKVTSDLNPHCESLRSVFYVIPAWATLIGILAWSANEFTLFAFNFTIYEALLMLNGELEKVVTQEQSYSGLLLDKNQSRSFVQNLEKLRLRYVEVCGMADRMGRCYSAYATMSLSCCFAVIITCVALIALSMKEFKKLENETLFGVLLAIYFCWQLSKMFLLCYVCSYPQAAVRAIG
jgi:hypothetical protein